jgi:hypothetical protein
MLDPRKNGSWVHVVVCATERGAVKQNPAMFDIDMFRHDHSDSLFGRLTKLHQHVPVISQ